MITLPMTDTSAKACLELEIPLHANTDSATHVAQLVGTLLDNIAGVGEEVSHADVLQALAITTAVRVGMADAAAQVGADVPLKLLDVQAATAGADTLCAA
jgi:hypothetical protein